MEYASNVITAVQKFFMSTIVDDGWFEWDEEKVFSSEDGSTITTQIESINDPLIFLELFDEMQVFRCKEIDGVDVSNDDEIISFLSEKENKQYMVYTIDFSSSGVVGAGKEKTLIYRVLQIDGEEVAQDLFIGYDIELNSLIEWAMQEWKEENGVFKVVGGVQ